MVKVRRTVLTSDANAKRFVEHVFKVDTKHAIDSASWNWALRIQMKKLRGIIKRPIKADLTIRFKSSSREKWWADLENIQGVDLNYHGVIGEAAEKKMLERFGLDMMHNDKTSWGRTFKIENLGSFDSHFLLLKRLFLDNEVLPKDYPKGWKPHGKHAIPMKVFHNVSAFELTEKVLEIIAVKRGRVMIGFRFDSENKSLGMQIRETKTNGVNSEIINVMNEIDTEVRKHRTANNLLHKS